ncbi:D-sedoheptulose-7-phosphate isomerase [Rudaeicoccus suwonensis]|uniref:Phosphoheptose isomerase n=1 Tax=Rudaeicoccus suwonensis TaxID=657409 RepID=A0A561EAL0_9MICO|nr:SIS domain-containing protein [Rudaeicoccus suwonensis]TWE12639.1 phosphoheptose isomerase [Rudaeicoccus suwonensis]
MAGAELMSHEHALHTVGPHQRASAVAGQHRNGLAAWARLSQNLAEPDLTARVDAAGEALLSALVAGGTLLVAGNGGSAAIASHVAAEFIGKCIHDRDPLPAINLSESLSSVTAVGNDYGFEEVFARGVAAHGRPGDVLLAMSTSGTSPNILRALSCARERGLLTIALSGGSGGALPGAADHVLLAPSQETPRIQEVHMFWAHTWCEAVDVVCR